MGRLIAPPSDPYFNNVELLLHMNGINGSTTFTDSSKNNFAVTVNANAQISTAQSKYGGSSAYFDGNEDYLDISNLPSDYLSQDFTIEAWVWLDSSKINSCLFNTFPHNSFGVSLNREDTGGRTSFGIGDGVTWYGGIESDTPLSFNTWQHIAFVRSNNTITLYENGIARASTNFVPSGFGTSCRIGSITWLGGLNDEGYKGYMQDFRITKGIARYTSNFVPQNKEFYDGKIIKNISIKKQNLGSGKIIAPRESKYELILTISPTNEVYKIYTDNISTAGIFGRTSKNEYNIEILKDDNSWIVNFRNINDGFYCNTFGTSDNSPEDFREVDWDTYFYGAGCPNLNYTRLDIIINQRY